MTNLYRDYGVNFVPFHLRVEAASQARSYIGGDPPVGIVPAHAYGQTRHLGTLALEEDLDVSMFATFDYSASRSPFDFFSKTCVLQDRSSPLVQFTLHRPSAKAVGSPLRGESEALALVFGPPARDPKCTTVAELGLAEEIYQDHKVGGMPFFDQLEDDVGAALHILDEGFIHLLQVSSLGKLDSTVHGSWCFGETTFHVFARKERDAFDFRYIWG